LFRWSDRGGTQAPNTRRFKEDLFSVGTRLSPGCAFIEVW
jgi:hypothetical protein